VETARGGAGGRGREDGVVVSEDLPKTLIQAFDLAECTVIVNGEMLLATLDHAAQCGAQLVATTFIFARKASGEIGLHDYPVAADRHVEPIRQGDFRDVAAMRRDETREGLLSFGVRRDTAPVAVFSPLQLREQSPRHYGNTLCA